MFWGIFDKYKRKPVSKMPVSKAQVEELLYNLDDYVMVNFSYDAPTGMTSIGMSDNPYEVINQFEKRVKSEHKDFQAELRIYNNNSKEGLINIEHQIEIEIQERVDKKGGMPRKDLLEKAYIKYVVNF